MGIERNEIARTRQLPRVNPRFAFANALGNIRLSSNLIDITLTSSLWSKHQECEECERFLYSVLCTK